MTGQGKSQFVKNYIKGKKSFVFDVNNEYNGIATDRDCDLNEKLYLQRCLSLQNTICVLEEATGFIEGRTSKELRRALVHKRHSGNIYILVFHSISAVPPRVLQLANWVVLFKTGDEDYQVEQKYPSLYSHYLELKSKPIYTHHKIKMIAQ